jgi:RNA polymerase sigma factor (sigma-70 family)
MVSDRTTAVVSSRFAVIEGVLRLSAAALPGIEHVRPVTDRDRIVAELATASPAIVVIDLEPVGPDAVELVRTVARASDGAPLVLLTDRVDASVALEAMRSGVRGFLVKPDALRELAPTLRRILTGERIIDPAIEQASVEMLGRFARRTREGAEVEAALSPREMEILILMGEGLTMQQIARRLGISPRTVETHATKLYRKLEVRTRVQAVAKAASIGLIELG